MARRWRLILCALVLVILAAAGPTLARGGVMAQEDDGALRTAVADVQTRLSVLETRVAAAPATPAAPPAGAGGTPAANATPAVDGDVAPWLAGELPGALPAGDPGVAAVVAVGAPVGSLVPLVVRNNTGADVFLRNVLGTARDAAGTLVASAQVSSFSPYLLRSGQVAVGFVNFGFSGLPVDATFEFAPDVQPVATGRSERQDVEIVEISVQGNRIVGLVRAREDLGVRGTISVVGVCFDADGSVRGYYNAYANKDALAPGETAGFDARIEGTGSCDAFVIGSYGFY